MVIQSIVGIAEFYLLFRSTVMSLFYILQRTAVITFAYILKIYRTKKDYAIE